MQDIGFWLAGVIAAILVGASKGGLPVIGMLAVPIFALTISPVVAAGILLPVYVVSDMFGLWAYRHKFSARVIALLLPGALLGILIGWATAHIVPEAWVRLLVGVVGTAFALNAIFGRKAAAAPREAKFGAGSFWGLITGFTSFVSHSGGPPYQIYVLPLQLDKAVFAGTATIFFAIVNAVKLIPYWALGQFSPENLKVAAILAVPAGLSVFFGVWAVKRLPEKQFFALVRLSLLLISLKLIWDGLAAIFGF